MERGSSFKTSFYKSLVNLFHKRDRDGNANEIGTQWILQPDPRFSEHWQPRGASRRHQGNPHRCKVKKTKKKKKKSSATGQCTACSTRENVLGAQSMHRHVFQVSCGVSGEHMMHISSDDDDSNISDNRMVLVADGEVEKFSSEDSNYSSYEDDLSGTESEFSDRGKSEAGSVSPCPIVVEDSLISNVETENHEDSMESNEDRILTVLPTILEDTIEEEGDVAPAEDVKTEIITETNTNEPERKVKSIFELWRSKEKANGDVDAMKVHQSSFVPFPKHTSKSSELPKGNTNFHQSVAVETPVDETVNQFHHSDQSYNTSRELEEEEPQHSVKELRRRMEMTDVKARHEEDILLSFPQYTERKTLHTVAEDNDEGDIDEEDSRDSRSEVHLDVSSRDVKNSVRNLANRMQMIDEEIRRQEEMLDNHQPLQTDDYKQTRSKEKMKSDLQHLESPEDSKDSDDSFIKYLLELGRQDEMKTEKAEDETTTSKNLPKKKEKSKTKDSNKHKKKGKREREEPCAIEDAITDLYFLEVLKSKNVPQDIKTKIKKEYHGLFNDSKTPRSVKQSILDNLVLKFSFVD